MVVLTEQNSFSNIYHSQLPFCCAVCFGKSTASASVQFFLKKINFLVYTCHKKSKYEKEM